ncbi:MAG: M20/M25/M40 family metallo-hydrolase [Prolixibacteraceae bacterium]|nr:M20/M25/M40 family metallo-hydrolase [Prolixibacteraceae bacterium]
MKFKIYLSLLLIFAVLSSVAQKNAIESITENDLKAHLEFIASDYLQGRDFNTEIPGLEITAEYLKAHCRKMGLKPGADDFFQPVEMISVKPDMENTVFQLIGENNKVAYKNNDIFSLGNSSGNDTVTGSIVFAGYGWYNDDTKYNDTEGLDIKGKIVVVMTRNLEIATGKSDEENSINTEMRKMTRALMGGAKALILVSDPMNPEPDWIGSVKKYATGGRLQLKGSTGGPTMPIKLIFATEELADEIVKESGKTLAELQKEINDSGSPKSFEIKNYIAKIQLINKTEPSSGKNVVGLIEGSDPVLKNEYVVFTAHYDHLGVSSDGEIYNGADDNGTGTTALLEIADAFMHLKKKPKRSIVFVWVTAEEKGLIGSDYYSQHPVFPLENTLADINIDMIGRSAEKEPEKGTDLDKSLAGPNGIYIVSGKQSSDLTKISNKVCEELNLVPSDDLTEQFLTRSDYYHFYKHGIPILGVSTGLHEDYHRTTDEVDKIDYTKMKRVTQYAFLVADKIANQKKRIVVDNPVSGN